MMDDGGRGVVFLPHVIRLPAVAAMVVCANAHCGDDD